MRRTCSHQAPPELEVDEIAALHTEVYSLGHKYDIPALCDCAVGEFKERAQDGKPESARTCLKTADIVYSETLDIDRVMRDEVAAPVSTLLRSLIAGDSENAAILDNCPQLASDVFKHMAKSGTCECSSYKSRWITNRSKGVAKYCPECKTRCYRAC